MVKCICIHKVRMPIQLLNVFMYVCRHVYVVYGIYAYKHVIQFFPTERVKDIRYFVLFLSLHNHMAFTTVTALHCFTLILRLLATVNGIAWTPKLPAYTKSEQLGKYLSNINNMYNKFYTKCRVLSRATIVLCIILRSKYTWYQSSNQQQKDANLFIFLNYIFLLFLLNITRFTRASTRSLRGSHLLALTLKHRALPATLPMRIEDTECICR